MANSEELKQIIGKLMSDADYRSRFAADPQGAASSINVRLSDGQVQKAKQFNGSGTALQNMSDTALRQLVEKAGKDDVHATWGEAN